MISSMNFDGDSILIEDLGAATPSLHTGVGFWFRPIILALRVIFLTAALLGLGWSVEDVPNTRIITLTGLEEVCIV